MQTLEHKEQFGISLIFVAIICTIFSTAFPLYGKMSTIRLGRPQKLWVKLVEMCPLWRPSVNLSWSAFDLWKSCYLSLYVIVFRFRKFSIISVSLIESLINVVYCE